MSEQPYMRLWTADWRDGTRTLSYEAKGFYIDLLSIMWDARDGIPADPARIGVAMQCDLRTARRMVSILFDAGKLICVDGKLWNPRLLRELLPDFSETSAELPADFRRTSARSPAKRSGKYNEIKPSANPTISTSNSISKKEDPKAPKRGPSPQECLEAFEAYNATALECGLPQAAKLTKDRERKIRARLAEYGLDGWKQSLANIERSSFLTGSNDRSWRANLEFLLQPSSFAKVHDGGYGNGRHRKLAEPVKRPAWIDEGLREMRELGFEG